MKILKYMLILAGAFIGGLFPYFEALVPIIDEQGNPASYFVTSDMSVFVMQAGVSAIIGGIGGYVAWFVLHKMRDIR